MHNTLPKLGNGKEQQQTKFYKKLSGELIFSRATKNLKMFYFIHMTGRGLEMLRLQFRLTQISTLVSFKRYLIDTN